MTAVEKSLMAGFAKLPLKSRLSLVKKMILSLEQEQTDIKKAWLLEAERRIDAALRSEEELLPVPDFIAELRRKIRK